MNKHFLKVHRVPPIENKLKKSKVEKKSPWVKDKHSKKNFKYIYKMNENKNMSKYVGCS